MIPVLLGSRSCGNAKGGYLHRDGSAAIFVFFNPHFGGGAYGSSTSSPGSSGRVFAAAIPFYQNQLLGDAFYVVALSRGCFAAAG